MGVTVFGGTPIVCHGIYLIQRSTVPADMVGLGLPFIELPSSTLLLVVHILRYAPIRNP